jgi:signal transduction histidine kinase
VIDREELRHLRHDVRSPLMVISGFARLLAGDDGITEEQRRDYAQRIERAAADLQRLLDEALADRES